MRKILLTVSLLFGGCFAQMAELEKELKDARLLAALGLLEAQNKGSSSGFTPAISMEAMGDDTYYVSLYDLTFTKCQLGASGYGCGEGTAGTYQFCNATDNSCNGGTDTGTLDGGGTSSAYTACNTLTRNGKSDWRVPNRANFTNLNKAVFANQLTLGFSSLGGWSSDSLSATNAYIATGGSNGSKTMNVNVRCVRDGR